MRAVTGSVASSKPISLSKAAAVLSRFASTDTGAPGEVAAYLRRASSAFDDLARFHREVRDRRLRRRRSPGLQADEPNSEDRRKKRAGGDPREEEEREGLGDGGDGNLTDVERESRVGIGRGEDGKAKMKRGVDGDEGWSHLGANAGKMVAGEEVERRKKKRNRPEEEVGEGLQERMTDGDGKKRRSLGVEGNGGALGDESEWQSRKKRRRKIEGED